MGIVLMKLVSGEELVAETSDDSFIVGYKRPRVLQVMQQSSGQMGAALVPWMLADQDGTFSIDDRHIMAKVTAPSEIEKVYRQQTSGIEIASSF